ncbi:MAG TPA: ABC transporter permease [Vicinamibacterales bacterium]|nr:ABC transporter permease [Vicinamibacterales bacterium]
MIRRLRAWALRLASFAGVGRSDRDIDEELATHRALLEANYRRSGLSDSAARRAAAAAFGPITLAAAAYRDRRGIRPIEDLVDDLFETSRSLVRSRSRVRHTLSVIALLSVCLTIGSCIFAVVDGLLLKPLPVRNPSRLFIAGPPNRLDPSRPDSVDLEDLDVLAHTPGVDDVLAYDFAPDRDKNQTRPDRERHVSASFFSTLGVTPLLGRALGADDAGSSPRAVVIGYGLWRSALGGDPGVIGRVVSIGDARVLVRGVMPRGFDFPRATTIWSLAPLTNRRPNGMRMRSMAAVVRLAPGTTSDTLRLSDNRVVAVPLAQYLRPRDAWSILPISIAALFMVVMGLIHLFVAQTTHAIARAKETAIRIALGSGWARIARQSLCENAWFTIAAVGIAATMAPATLALLIRLLPAELTFGQPIAIDRRVWAVAGAIALATLAALTIASLAAIRRATLTDLLRGRLTRARLAVGPRVQTVVLAVQVAVVTSLVYVGTLALHSFSLADRASLGVETDGLVAVEWSGDLRRDASSSTGAVRGLAARVQQVPDVVAVAHGPSPLEPNRLILQLSATPLRSVADARAMPLVDIRGVSANYFRTAGIPLIDGRAFDSSDEERDVAIVSHAFATHFFPNVSPIGRSLYDGAPRPLQIVGVAGDIRVMGPEAPPRALVYLPSGAAVGKGLIVRLRPDAPLARLTDIGAIARNAVADARTVTVVDVAQQRDRLLDGQRARATLLGVLGIVGFGLGLAGVLAMAGDSVQRGLRDAAIRLALGARPSRVVRHLIARVLLAVGAGLIVGIAGGLGAAQWAASIFYGVHASDPIALAAVAALVAGGAAFATLIPARRAARINVAGLLNDE